MLCLLASGEHWTRPENLFVLNASKACFVIIDMQNFSCAPANGEPLPHIDQVITNRKNEEVYARVKEGVANLCGRFPLYTERLED